MLKIKKSVRIKPHIVNNIYLAHDGRHYIPLLITEKIVGFCIGQFVLTRKIKKNQ